MERKKSLGQNFLKSETALSAIIEASDPTADDIILEVGPGEGVLTEKLLQYAGKVIVVEKDRRLIPFLTEKFKMEIETGKLQVIEKDILEFDLSLMGLNSEPYKVVANIPYYITGQLLRMFLESEKQPKLMTILLQKEVAERIVARDKKESLLSLSVKAYGKPILVRTVGRGAFSPQPNVDSAILLIEAISRNNFESPEQEKKFFEVLHAGFAHKRKQLLPNLASQFDKKMLTGLFEENKLDLRCRAEDVDLSVWLKFSKRL
jgi:16S rRNA (adenine1518-N6/adenine1519-N6)-dimethyltransferase